MGYYRGDCPNYAAGDYYTGDYYRGDPGLLGFLGKVGKKLVGTALSFVPGGGVLKTLAATAIPTFRRTEAISRPGPGGLPMISAGVEPTFNGAPQFPTAVGPFGTMTPGGFIQGCQLKGTRPNKSGYYKQIVKGNPFNVVFVPKGSVCVKSRRLNVANPRALRRSIRRAQGFAKLARRVMTFVSARAPKGRPKFRRR